MKALHRSTFLAAGIAAALAVTAMPIAARAQRQQGPGPDTKKVLVTAFRGELEGGIRLADEIRNRIAGDFSIRTLMPISKKDIETTLNQSGYRPDSALNPNDIKELAKLVRADEVIDGAVIRMGAVYRVTARMFLPRDVSLSQPLVTDMDTKDLPDAARIIVHEYDLARTAIPDNQACENGIRASTPAVAIAAARKGLTTYPKSTLVRLCMATAYESYKLAADSTGPWKDSVISITKQILALDKTSKIALTQQYGAYKLKHDTTNALQSLIGLMNADPTNSTLREQVINELVNSKRADSAVSIAKQLVVENPGDPQYAKTYWQVLRIAGRLKEAIPAGVAYVTLDTVAADSNYFYKQIQDELADSSYAKAAEFASLAAAKYPRSAQFLMIKAQNERRAGQLPSAKATLIRALEIDPGVHGANFILAQISHEMGATDDAIKYAKADAAADPANKARAAQMILIIGKKQYDAAVLSKVADDFKKAIPLLQLSDSLAPTANAKFFLAVSAYQTLGLQTDALQKSRSCDDFKAANDLLTIVAINMGPGGSVSPATAQQIMTAAPQFQKFVDDSMKKHCK